MAGKSWQPSHEPPRGREDLHLSHWLNSGKREREGGNILEDVLPHKNAHFQHYPCNGFLPTLLSLSTRRNLAHAHIKTLLTSKGMQALFVVNSVKLHLTAYNYILINQK